MPITITHEYVQMLVGAADVVLQLVHGLEVALFRNDVLMLTDTLGSEALSQLTFRHVSTSIEHCHHVVDRIVTFMATAPCSANFANVSLSAERTANLSNEQPDRLVDDCCPYIRLIVDVVRTVVDTPIPTGRHFVKEKENKKKKKR